jgi:hypothetical protein
MLVRSSSVRHLTTSMSSIPLLEKMWAICPRLSSSSHLLTSFFSLSSRPSMSAYWSRRGKEEENNFVAEKKEKLFRGNLPEFLPES